MRALIPSRPPKSIELTLNRYALFQLFKYTVYVLLTFNVYWFWTEEHAANLLLYPDGIGMLDVYDAYTAAIDTAAWVILLLMFELETYVLEDRHFTRRVIWSLHTLRAICYLLIVRMFLGYIQTLFSVLDVSTMQGVSDLCMLVTDGWSYSPDIEEYTLLTASNCSTFSPATSFLQFADARAVVDAAGHTDIVRLALVDVINSGVWLLVVLVLEVDVFLQERNRYEGLALRISTILKFILYGTLLLAAIYWGVKGDFVDFWDAFLWLVAFVFIELNVFEWRQEELQSQG
jgi:hypothetical protein